MLSLIGGDVECAVSETQELIAISAYFTGFTPIEGEDTFSFAVALLAPADTVLDATRPTNTSLQDLWRTPTSLEDYEEQSFIALGRPNRSDATGPYSSLTVIPEPSAVTNLLGAAAMGLLIRRRSLQR